MPFKKATDDLLGINGNYFMITYGETKKNSAFKTYARAKDLPFDIANAISKKLSEYEKAVKHSDGAEVNIEEYITDPEQLRLLKESEVYQGIIDNISPSPCFEKGTKILTSKGYKNIEYIKTGDEVITHTNNYRKVITPMKKYSDKIYSVKVMGNIPIKVTGEHPFYVITRNGSERYWDEKLNKYCTRRKFTAPYWKEAKDLTKNDFIARAINQNSIIHTWEHSIDHGSNRDISTVNIYNNDFWWLIGRYIGDGWHTKYINKQGWIQYYRVIICCNKNNNELNDITTKMDKCSLKYSIHEEPTVYKITVSSKDLYEFVDQFGNDCYTKKLTDTIFDLPVDKIKSFLEGYFSADGHLMSDGSQSCCSVSYELILGIQTCIHKAYKAGTRINVKKGKDDYILCGRHVKTVNSYDLRFYYETPKTAQYIYKDEHIWQPVREVVELQYDDYVYNMSVEQDESYTANNIIVHNCSHILLNQDIRREIGITKIKDVFVANITGKEADELKYLKND